MMMMMMMSEPYLLSTWPNLLPITTSPIGKLYCRIGQAPPPVFVSS